jgi:hypothetical protein
LPPSAQAWTLAGLRASASAFQTWNQSEFS